MLSSSGVSSFPVLSPFVPEFSISSSVGFSVVPFSLLFSSEFSVSIEESSCISSVAVFPGGGKATFRESIILSQLKLIVVNVKIKIVKKVL